MLAFQFAAFYGIALGAVILSGNLTVEILGLFCDKGAYTLGNFGQVWANWHAIGCLFVGLTNLSVARDPTGQDFGAGGRLAVAQNTAFIFGVWGIQNTYYCNVRQDLFTPPMWLNAVGCLVACALSIHAATRQALSTAKR